MRKIELSKANATLAEYARDLSNAPLVLTSRGKPVAALVPVEGMDWESLSVSTDPEFIDLIERSRRRHKAEGGISSEEVRVEFGLPPYVQRKPKSNHRHPRRKARKPKTTSHK